MTEVVVAEEKSIERPLKAKHPLRHKWAFWFLKGDRSRDWEDCLKQVVVLETVEDFWALYLRIIPASDLTFGSDYYLFKDGIKPMWEDPKNVKGGRWMVVVPKAQRATKLDELWLEIMMDIIGERFESQGEFICGAAVNVRQKGDKIALWTSDASLDDVNRRIGMTLKNKLALDDNIRYEIHKDASARIGSVVRPKIVIPKDNKELSNKKFQSSSPA
ncbi:unnamed protein product [Bursaphelenchus okinawaensis]|uniref:eIF-4F 25 kDa subunit n=1 Tax=Bursaphelenchus okinawaensis TaxID=465554 RepID=A0A811LA81_9BILA|nr:unnamed protein product [Bursaphelenchus okinawaensis]CAG9119918.1 unnamed protein product [Bursaphelenchus okinawaensis]